jgi:oxalate decarboxylase
MLNGPQPIRGNLGASVIGPRDLPIERENPDQLTPPRTDSGTVS